MEFICLEARSQVHYLYQLVLNHLNKALTKVNDLDIPQF